MIKTTFAGQVLADALERQQRWFDEHAVGDAEKPGVSIEPSPRKLSTWQPDAGQKLRIAETDALQKLQGTKAGVGQKLRMAKADSPRQLYKPPARGRREPFVDDPDAGFDWRSIFRLDDELR